MADPKLCDVCGDPIGDKGRKYCKDCRAWIKDVDSSKHNCKPTDKPAPKRCATGEVEA